MHPGTEYLYPSCCLKFKIGLQLPMDKAGRLYVGIGIRIEFPEPVAIVKDELNTAVRENALACVWRVTLMVFEAPVKFYLLCKFITGYISAVFHKAIIKINHE